MIAEISNRGLNGTAAKKFIKGQVSMMAAYLERLKSPDAGDALMDLEMIGATQQGEAYLRKLTREYEAALRLAKQQNIDVATQALALHHRLIGQEGSESLVEDLQRRRAVLGFKATSLVAKV